MRVEPPPSPWVMPEPSGPDEVVGIGADLEPLVVADAIDDAAIANSPRLPSAEEVAGILASVRG